MSKTFIFTVFNPVPGTTTFFVAEMVRKQASSFEEALEQLTQSHPHHNIVEHMRGLWKVEE